jgi:hypothetical protein
MVELRKGRSRASTSWRIQLLTPEHLVEGIYDDRNDNETAMYFFQGRTDSDGKLAMGASLHLTTVRISSTRDSATPVSSAAEWWSFPNNLVAVMPHDDDSLAYVAKKNDSKHVIPADVYAGPYRIQGAIMSPNKELSILRYYFNFAVRDVEIVRVDADGAAPALRVPYAIVRTHLLQGIARNA